ncbi:MAG: diacylglycerol kinase [Chitinophagaceae bacterium]|nr:diacylglycerol kinase [Chitinophagaceae bacterium]
MERKIVYLINPISGTKGKKSVKQAIISATERRNIPFEILHTVPSGDYGFLKNRIINENITDVVVCGGDGSVSAVAAVLKGVDVNTGIIPLGSGNGLALSAGIPRSPEKALEIVFKGKASFVDGFYINDSFSCMLCGLGFDAQVAHQFALQKRRGLATYVRISTINFFSSRHYPFTITAEGRSFSTDAFFLSIANSNQFGNNVKIAPRASLSDGLLDIVIIKRMNKMLLPFSLLAQFNGFNAHQQIASDSLKSRVLYFQTGHLTIANEGLAPLHIDGDPVATSASFNIRIARNAIRLLQP